MRRDRAILTLLAVLLLAGCVRQPATALPASPYPPSPTQAGGPTIELPPRPRDVPLDGLDPCTLLTPVQQDELGLQDDREPLLTMNNTALYGGVTPLCTARGYVPRAISLGVNTVPIRGIERFTGGSIDATITPIDIRGFPALLLVPPRYGYCTVIVDVAPGQLIDVQFANGGREPPIPQADICEGAQLTARLAMDTLLTLR
ncbi:MAG: DUF3558 domain-containing protein [Pseudonocardia sp.]|nr:DUF3558 domain-containing protein [Pseudonocardia sp.]